MSGQPAADTLYKTDAEIAGILGVASAKWSANAAALEKSGLPRRDPMFDGKRYWPAVRAFLDRRNGVTVEGAIPAGPDGEENWEWFRERTRKRRA